MLETYANGNTVVMLFSDGTKIRYVPDNEKPMPIRPESIDLKVTDWCDMGCKFCHEGSKPDGKHGDLSAPVLDSIRPGTELAIGGGNPLSHPFIESFLIRMRDRGVICNMTLNWKHFDADYSRVVNFIQRGLIHGLGVSMNELIPHNVVTRLMCHPNIVVHTIAGVAPQGVYEILSNKDLNLLILGYKTFGRGVFYRQENSIVAHYEWLKDHVMDLMPRFRTVAFDNLALEQLEIKSKLTPEVWKQFYMGDDGAFTMYIDLVDGAFAKSSVSQRYPIDTISLCDMFAKVRKERTGE